MRTRTPARGHSVRPAQAWPERGPMMVLMDDPVEQARQEHQRQIEQSKRWYDRAIRESQDALASAQEFAQKLRSRPSA